MWSVIAAMTLDGKPAEWFAGWGTLSLINAGLAQSKNRSGLGWWLISLIAGPIATFCLVALCEKMESPAN